MSFKPSVVLLFAAGLLTSACGGATRSGSPQSPTGTAVLTGAKLGVTYQRVLVAERGIVVMVAREGCVATVSSSSAPGGQQRTAGGDQSATEEMHVRCPRPERLKAWFSAVDKLTAQLPVEQVSADADDIPLPAAELVTAKGDVLQVAKRADAERLLGEVRALVAELAAAETPSPGPSSANGWQMLRVSGPAHVILGGNEAAGLLEARMSTNGQYLCDFAATTPDGPIRATKSGWISPAIAARAIDDVLAPLADGTTSSERRPTTIAAGISSGNERRANVASTGAVFQKFAHVQEALGDACLPELDPPSAQIGL